MGRHGWRDRTNGKAATARPVEIGYKLSCEEFGPADLVRFAVRAEQAGFDFALASDHYHPWTDRQGQSPFVWTVLGAIGQATSRLRVGTAVTCPILRVHPAIVAQAAATTAALMEGRFFLGVGTGENLNEHVVGEGWPSPPVRLEMLEEAITVIRLLWEGGPKSHRGRHFCVEHAQLYTLPDEPPQIMVAACQTGSANLAGRLGDAMINVEVKDELIESFAAAGGADAPRFVEVSVCWGADEERARKTAHEIWALAALPGMLFTELPHPAHFESALEPITEERVAESVVCGPDVEPYVEAVQKAQRAGYTNVCLHQIGPEQEGFIEFVERELLPALGDEAAPRRKPPVHAHRGRARGRASA